MASNTQLCEPATRLEGSFCSEKLPSQSPAKPASPSAKTIGSRQDVRTRKVTTTAATSIRLSELSGRGPRPLPRRRPAVRRL